MVAKQLGHKYADSLIGIQVSAPMILSAFFGERPCALLDGQLGRMPPDMAAHAVVVERRLAWHVTTQMLDLQTLSHAMHVSSTGMLARLLEWLWAWRDCDGDVEQALTRDDILTKVTLYWVTESFGTTVGATSRLGVIAGSRRTIASP